VRRIFAIIILIATLYSIALGQSAPKKRDGNNVDSIKETLIDLEKQAWEAWKNKDGKFYQNFLSEDTVAVGRTGVDKKAAIIRDISESKCEIRGYSLDNYDLVMVDKNTAILTFKATQDYTCEGEPGPSPIWASSVYVKRRGKWLNVKPNNSRNTGQTFLKASL
jgi:murein L,D-transpeptidase YafK